MPNILSVLGYIWSHPANRGCRVRAIARAVGWQLRKRLLPGARDIRVFGGLTLRCYPDSHSASLVIYCDESPDYHEMHFIRRYLRPGDAVLDVGANIGVYSLLAASQVGPAGRVLALARGEVICFLNADDHYASPKVLSQVARKMQVQRLDALMGDVGYFHERSPQRIVRRYRSDRFTPERLGWGWMPAHPALFLQKKVVQRVGKFKTDYRIAGDFEFIVRAFHGHALRYEHVPEVLVHMQTGGASTGGWRSKVLLNQEVLRACRENDLQTHMLKILSKYPAKLTEIVRL